MSLFGGSRRSRRSGSNTLWVPPSGLITTPQRLQRSVPFVFDMSQQPAFEGMSLLKGKPQHASLIKSIETAKQAFLTAELSGLRAEIIVLVDDSYSMMDEFRDGLVQQLLIHALGWGFNLDKNGITVIVYGRPNEPFTLTVDNYLDAPNLVKPTFGGTPMAGAFEAALKISAKHDKLTIIINLTDGNPNDTVAMSNAVVRSSGGPDILKNVAIKKVKYLVEIDDLPSRFEVRKDEDGEPIKDADGHITLIPNEDGTGIRLIDTVDSVEISDPFNATDEEYAGAFTQELSDIIEAMGIVGSLTGMERFGVRCNPAFV